MAIRPFESGELTFAFSNRIYFRFKTYRNRSSEILSSLCTDTLEELLKPYDIHVLESACDCRDVKLLVSLLPSESASSAASKIKGRISKWLSEQLADESTVQRLGRGYFAVTTGKSAVASVSSYLDRQSEHHGYDRRVRPPVFVKSFPHNKESADILSTAHAVAALRYHIVLATQGRKGVFCRHTAASLADHWQESSAMLVLDKVSFVPDHVHVAAAVHPTLSPAAAILSLMNDAQEFMFRHFQSEILRARVSRLWLPSAYLGSFGELKSAAISAYVRRWQRAKSS